MSTYIYIYLSFVFIYICRYVGWVWSETQHPRHFLHTHLLVHMCETLDHSKSTTLERVLHNTLQRTRGFADKLSALFEETPLFADGLASELDEFPVGVFVLSPAACVSFLLLALGDVSQDVGFEDTQFGEVDLFD